jgi:hypothetical protein
MREIKLIPEHEFGRAFISEKYLPPGKDEFYLRNEQSPKPDGSWRHLRANEIETLVKNAVTSDDWDSIFVSDPFHPHLLKNCSFWGMVRIGRLENVILQHHELQVPAGITNSRIISCDIGDNCAIHNVRYLARYILGDHVILLNIDEMNTTNHAKFGNGIVKDGEAEQVRIWMDVMNETGSRAVLPFDGMIAADAYLWARYRDDADLLAKLGEITERQFDSRRGFYGTVGDGCVIKNSGIVKDVQIGPHCYIKGANKLKNLTINSSGDEPSQVGEGVELVNGIVGLGCHIFYGCKAVRFVMGNNSSLKYGARLIHSLLGDNSTVSCCEILNTLIFPAHEQHHNNSFLVAALLMGQSNLAAAASVGSNHNSRANDGEIQAGRGFWPGLGTTLKHCCRFASFVLVAKADYASELNIPLPFSLVSNDVANDRLLVMPAFWWLHNMYALARNSRKYQTRDMRKTKVQHVEFDYLAPDTAEEMFEAMRLLEIWTAKAHLRAAGRSADGRGDDDLAGQGRELLLGPAESVARLEVLGEVMENSRRNVVILKPREAYHAYRQMLHFYAMRNLLAFIESDAQATLRSMQQTLATAKGRQRHWVNLGGQLTPANDVDRLRADIRSGRLATWSAIHQAYDELWAAYPLEKQRHAYACLLDVLGTRELTPQLWHAALEQAVRTQEYVEEQVYQTRAKDYSNPFRQTTFRNAAEMQAVFGPLEQNSFVKQTRKETAALRELVDTVRRRG